MDIMAVIRALKARKQPDDEKAARSTAEEINKALPESLSGRQAVLKKRQQMADIDKMMEEANR